MIEYVYIGRRRHPLRTLAYGVLTFGVYGRILVYRQIKEIDGHRALFTNLPLLATLLLLPILGPLFVKWHLRGLLLSTVARDVTHPPVRRRVLGALTLVPWIPAFALLVQHHLNLYWRRQQKVEEVKHKQAEIQALKAASRTKANLARVAELEGQVARREKALRDEEEAAAAIRAAMEERRRAEAEHRRLRRGPVRRLVGRLGAGKAAALRRRKERRAASRAERAEAEAPRGVRGKKAPDAAPLDEKGSEVDGPRPSWKARRAARRKARTERREARRKAKEAKRPPKPAKERPPKPAKERPPKPAKERRPKPAKDKTKGLGRGRGRKAAAKAPKADDGQD